MSEIIKYAKLYKRIRQKYATDIKQTNHINSMNNTMKYWPAHHVITDSIATS